MTCTSMGRVGMQVGEDQMLPLIAVQGQQPTLPVFVVFFATVDRSAWVQGNIHSGIVFSLPEVLGPMM